MERQFERKLNLEKRLKQHRIPGIGISAFSDSCVNWSFSMGVVESGTKIKVNKDTLFNGCSISKMVSCLGVLRLAQHGIVNLEEDVNKYLKSWKVIENSFTDKKKVTLLNLLAHQSGFIDPDGSFEAFNKNDIYPSLANILAGKTSYNSENLYVKYEPETEFIYSDAGFCIIEQIIEDVTGKTFSVAMEHLIFKPLGLRRTFFWKYSDNEILKRMNIKRCDIGVGHTANGLPIEGKQVHYPNLAGSGIWSTPAEMAIITIEIIKAWNGEYSSILCQESACKMLAGFGCDKFVGLGIFVPQKNGKLAMVSKGWGVGFQSILIADPNLKRGVIVMINSDPGKPQEESLIGEIINEINDFYGWSLFL
ncbi:serine hydrolase domain-containing protein [Metabacillus idriensis]|uniref:serine hydrolase domain-containing protein n=1 Tax=Metabacillus idriensis TaxID=324768 RepID=UPI001748525A|nr:serine hydrolase domain-containing protein [Metabacillus idriensis]